MNRWCARGARAAVFGGSWACAALGAGCWTIEPNTVVVRDGTGLADPAPTDPVLVAVKITKFDPAGPWADVEMVNVSKEPVTMSAVGMRRVLNAITVRDTRGSVFAFRVKRGVDLRIAESSMGTAVEAIPGRSVSFRHTWDEHLALVNVETGAELGPPSRLVDLAQGGAAWTLDTAVARPAGTPVPKGGPAAIHVAGEGRLW